MINFYVLYDNCTCTIMQYTFCNVYYITVYIATVVTPSHVHRSEDTSIRLLALVNSLLLTLKCTYYIGSMVLNRQSLGTGLMVLHSTHLSLVVQPISTIAVRVILSNEVQHLQSLYYEEAGQ